MKVVFPALWIAGFGMGTMVLWLGSFQGKNGVAPPTEMKWAFLAAWIAGTAFIWWTCAPLKRVRVDDKSIYLSNYLTEVCVPLAAIEDISENRWISSHPITVKFRYDTGFGDRITFMPKVRLFGLWSSHPVVGELHQLASRAGA
jgi:hypothetical protein